MEFGIEWNLVPHERSPMVELVFGPSQPQLPRPDMLPQPSPRPPPPLPLLQTRPAAVNRRWQDDLPPIQSQRAQHHLPSIAQALAFRPLQLEGGAVKRQKRDESLVWEEAEGGEDAEGGGEEGGGKEAVYEFHYFCPHQSSYSHAVYRTAPAATIAARYGSSSGAEGGGEEGEEGAEGEEDEGGGEEGEEEGGGKEEGRVEESTGKEEGEQAEKVEEEGEARQGGEEEQEEGEEEGHEKEGGDAFDDEPEDGELDSTKETFSRVKRKRHYCPSCGTSLKCQPFDVRLPVPLRGRFLTDMVVKTVMRIHGPSTKCNVENWKMLVAAPPPGSEERKREIVKQSQRQWRLIQKARRQSARRAIQGRTLRRRTT